MSQKVIKSNNFFSPLKIIQNKNSTRSQHNIFTSSERKKKNSFEKTQDFLSSTIKKTDEEEYEEIIQKRKNINKKIEEVILLLSQKQFTQDSSESKNYINQANQNFDKYLYGNNKKTKYKEKMEQNEILKERNTYLKKIIKEMRLKNELNNSKNIENNKNLTYDLLLRQNKELVNENKSLKEEYNLLKLENNTNLDKIMENKYEVISKMKTLKYTINNLINLISNQNDTDSNKNYNHSNYYNNPNLIKANPIKIYDLHDLPLKIEYQEQNNFSNNNSNIKDNKNNIDFNDNIIFTEGGNLNTNNNNSFYNENDNYNNNYNINNNDESSENEQFEISLKHFEKTENKNLNNLFLNSGSLSNNINLNKNHTENVTTRQNQNKKISIFTEKRKNTMTTNSYTKDLINKKMKKDFKKCFNEGKSNNEKNTNYNFFNFENICLDKKILFEGDKNIKSSGLKNNRTSSNYKNTKNNGKNSKGINENFRTKNINQKNYKINNSNNFRRMIKPSKKTIK